MDDLRGKTLNVKHVWIKNKICENVSITLNKSGVITEIQENVSDSSLSFENVVLVPGFVNTHSHAFHRHLRGRSEIGKSAADTFWKWRDNMYGLVGEINEDQLYQYCLTTFVEMLSAGITTVGEFHYVHHNDQKFDLDRAVIKAAIDSGIRLVLLQTLYERAGFENPPVHPVQERFISTYDEFIENLKLLRDESDHERISIGVAAHSTRAVSFENIRKLFEFASEQQIPFHIHLEEQPKEIIDCQKILSKTPSDWIVSNLKINKFFTAVHATYTSAQNMDEFTKHEANVSICPCTEGYLGDGIPRINDQLNISFGTDCNNRICFLEEMRWACFSQQMLHNSRSVCGLSSDKLLNCATVDGAKSLALSSKIGSFEIGKYFDAVAFSLTSRTLSHVTADTVIDSLILSCDNREISQVYVGGKRLINQ